MKAHQAIVAAPGFSLGLRCDEAFILEIEFLPPGMTLAATSLLSREKSNFSRRG